MGAPVSGALTVVRVWRSGFGPAPLKMATGTTVVAPDTIVAILRATVTPGKLCVL